MPINNKNILIERDKYFSVNGLKVLVLYVKGDMAGTAYGEFHIDLLTVPLEDLTIPIMKRKLEEYEVIEECDFMCDCGNFISEEKFNVLGMCDNCAFCS